MALKPLRVLQFALLSPLLIGLAAIAAPFVLLTWLVQFLEEISLLAKLRLAWPRGKFVLFAYTHSPVWSNYIEQTLLPKIDAYCIVINRSRGNWKLKHPLEVKAIAFWGGSTANNPIAIVCKGKFRAHTFRFYEEFRGYKHGKPSELEARVRDLLACVDSVLARHG